MLLAEYFGEKALELLEQQLQRYLEEKSLQKLLLQCFENVREVMSNSGKAVDGFCIDKRQIMNVNSDLIKPSLTEQQLLRNLNILFDNLLNMDGDVSNVRIQICQTYLKRAHKEMLELYHVYEKLEDVDENIKKIHEDNNSQHNKLSEGFEKLQIELGKSNTLYFIDELDNSRVIPYLDLILSEEMDDDIQGLIEEETGVCFEYFNYDSNGFKHVIITFMIGIKQCELKDFFSILDGVFVEEGIRIYNISI